VLKTARDLLGLLTQGQGDIEMGSKQVRSAVAVLLLSALAAAACGSDDSNKSAGGVATSAPPATTGGSPTPGVTAPTTSALANRPFKVMVIGDFTNVIDITVPDTLATTKAALKDVPGAEIIGCDAKGDANVTAACERKAIDEDVAAVVTGESSLTSEQSILTKAMIPTVGLVSATEPYAFALSNVLGAFAGVGVGIGKAGCKKAGNLVLSGAEFLADSIKVGIRTTGGDEVSRAAVPSNAPDLAPAISKLLEGGAECITVNAAPAMVVQALTAINQSGQKPMIALVDGVFPQATRKTVGPLGENALMMGGLLNPDDPSPVIAQIKSDMKQFDNKSPLTSYGVTAWTAAKVIEAAVRKMDGPINKVTLLAALNGLRDVEIPTMHSFSAVELPNPAYKRFFNHYLLNYRIHDTVPVADGDFYDIQPAFPK
jgi:hypothetical protein